MPSANVIILMLASTTAIASAPSLAQKVIDNETNIDCSVKKQAKECLGYINKNTLATIIKTNPVDIGTNLFSVYTKFRNGLPEHVIIEAPREFQRALYRTIALSYGAPQTPPSRHRSCTSSKSFEWISNEWSIYMPCSRIDQPRFFIHIMASPKDH